MMGSAVLIWGIELIRLVRLFRAQGRHKRLPQAILPRRGPSEHGPRLRRRQPAGHNRNTVNVNDSLKLRNFCVKMRWRKLVGVEHDLYPINDGDDRHLRDPAPAAPDPRGSP